MDLKWFDAYQKTELDLLIFKNTKYLLYRFNDLLESTGQRIIQIKHSKVTDDYIAAEEIQNQNWQYFIERVLQVCKAKEVGSTITKSEYFLLTTVKNVTMEKKSYQTFYNIIERNLYSTMGKLSIDECDKIKEDSLRENFWAESVVTNLDCWIAFYFQHGRFPGSQKLINIYVGHSLKDMLYPGDPIFFPQASTDDRNDFKLNVSGDDLIVFKSPALTVVSIAKKDLKDALDKTNEDTDISR